MAPENRSFDTENVTAICMAVVGVAFVVALATFLTLVVVHGRDKREADNERTERIRIEACDVIKDEMTRTLCINDNIGYSY